MHFTLISFFPLPLLLLLLLLLLLSFVPTSTSFILPELLHEIGDHLSMETLTALPPLFAKPSALVRIVENVLADDDKRLFEQGVEAIQVKPVLALLHHYGYHESTQGKSLTLKLRNARVARGLRAWIYIAILNRCKNCYYIFRIPPSKVFLVVSHIHNMVLGLPVGGLIKSWLTKDVKLPLDQKDKGLWKGKPVSVFEIDDLFNNVSTLYRHSWLRAYVMLGAYMKAAAKAFVLAQCHRGKMKAYAAMFMKLAIEEDWWPPHPKPLKCMRFGMWAFGVQWNDKRAHS